MGYILDKINAKLPQAYGGKLADTVDAFTGRRETAGSYDPATGTTPITVTNYSGRGVFGGYSVREVDDNHILITDIKLEGVLQNELINDVTGLPETPKVDDKVTRDGVTYSVINVAADPAGATFTLQLRRT